jgi:glycosyltransferase involved in cell wall biosynthesis
MKIIKVCFFIPTLRQGGGAARVFVNLASEMANQGIAVTIIVLGDDVNEPALPRGVVIERLHVSRALFSFFKLRKLLNRLEPDFVMSTMGHLNIMLAIVKPFVKSGPKYIARESNTVSMRLSDQRFRRSLTLMYRLLYKTFDMVIAQSTIMANDLVANFGVPRGLLKVIGNPVDFLKIQSLSSVETNVIEKRARYRLVTVGRHVAQKRFDLAIDVVGVLGNDYELVILGDGPFKNTNIKRANLNNSGDKVNFVPFQMNPFPIISTGDYYLITSEFEGLPNAALEALALGLPVFGFSSSGGLPDYINEDNGCLVEFGDVNGLAQVIKESKLRKGKSISKTVKERLSLDLICQQYLDTFFSLEKTEEDCS